MNIAVLIKNCRLGVLVCLLLSSTAFAQSGDQKLIESLKVYNDQLAKQIGAQNTAKSEIARSINAAKDLKPLLVKQMQDMLADLKQFVGNDLPFHRDERLASIGQLEALMLDAEARDSDRFRNILDLYTIELEYGNSTEAYADTVNIGGEEIEVDMLRIGRLALYYQTKDGKQSAIWDKGSKSWVELADGDNRHVRQAIKVAAKRIAPELMNLRITAPEGV